MTHNLTLSVELGEDLAARLNEKAVERGVDAGDLAREILREALGASDERFDRIAAYIVEKNRELYRRLS